MRGLEEIIAQGSKAAKSYPSSTGRQLLQYGYNNGYYNNGSYWGGGRIAGVVIGCVCFVFAVVFCILAVLMRRRRMARYQTNNARPTTGATYPTQAPVGTYPQGNTYTNQAYPQNTGGYNPAVPAGYNPGGYNPATAEGYPVKGTPTDGYNGVQMQPLSQEKPGYQSGYPTSM